jgi:hypothetical protein
VGRPEPKYATIGIMKEIMKRTECKIAGEQEKVRVAI